MKIGEFFKRQHERVTMIELFSHWKEFVIRGKNHADLQDDHVAMKLQTKQALLKSMFTQDGKLDK